MKTDVQPPRSLSRAFIERPRLAAVVAIVMAFAGILAQTKMMLGDIEGMKDELHGFVSAGGTIEQYGRRLVARQDEEIAIYMRACNEVEQASKGSADKTELSELVDRRNGELRRMGIRLIAMPEVSDN